MCRIKICGLGHSENSKAISQLPIHYMGFIFYSKSPRFVGEVMDEKFLRNLPSHIQKVGVFVNEKEEHLLAVEAKYDLDLLQLHGDESPEMCKNLRKAGAQIIKAFQIDEAFDFRLLANYEKEVDFFLFDTRSKQYGGSGQKFNWRVLDKYQGNTPFFLSGGIGPGDEKAIGEFHHPMLHALDLNSRFEDSPGLKNVRELSAFLGLLSENAEEKHKGN